MQAGLSPAGHARQLADVCDALLHAADVAVVLLPLLALLRSLSSVPSPVCNFAKLSTAY